MDMATIERAVEESKRDGASGVTDAIETAYGLLWLYPGVRRDVHAARRVLLAQLDKAGQARGITKARALLSRIEAGKE